MISILELGPTQDAVKELAAIHIEAVADNAGVSFLHPLAPEKAEHFWRGSLRQASDGTRIIFGAVENGAIVGTVTLLLDMPENQPHRAEIAKMMVAGHARGRGIASKLLTAAEDAARERGKTLLMLDTVKGSAAARLYTKMGWVFFGDVPGHALRGDGTPDDTSFFYKEVPPADEAAAD